MPLSLSVRVRMTNVLGPFIILLPGKSRSACIRAISNWCTKYLDDKDKFYYHVGCRLGYCAGRVRKHAKRLAIGAENQTDIDGLAIQILRQLRCGMNADLLDLSNQVRDEATRIVDELSAKGYDIHASSTIFLCALQDTWAKDPVGDFTVAPKDSKEKVL